MGHVCSVDWKRCRQTGASGRTRWRENWREIETTAIVGLGVVGEAMCRNLARKGNWAVLGADTRAEPLDRLAADGVSGATLDDACTRADMIILCLPCGAEVEAVTREAGGILAHSQAGQMVVDMSTSPPRLMRELAADFAGTGINFADAPVARTRQAAIDGMLCIMMGGSLAVYDRVRPVRAT